MLYLLVLALVGLDRIVILAAWIHFHTPAEDAGDFLISVSGSEHGWHVSA